MRACACDLGVRVPVFARVRVCGFYPPCVSTRAREQKGFACSFLFPCSGIRHQKKKKRKLFRSGAFRCTSNQTQDDGTRRGLMLVCVTADKGRRRGMDGWWGVGEEHELTPTQSFPPPPRSASQPSNHNEETILIGLTSFSSLLWGTLFSSFVPLLFFHSLRRRPVSFSPCPLGADGRLSD